MKASRMQSAVIGTIFAAVGAVAVLGGDASADHERPPAPGSFTALPPLPPLPPLQSAGFAPPAASPDAAAPPAAPSRGACWPGGVDARDGGCAACPKPRAIDTSRPVETKPGVALTIAHDERASRSSPRRLGLLVTAIQQIEQLLRVTADGAPDRVILLRRLAEDYVELAGSAAGEKRQAELDRDRFNAAGATFRAGEAQATASKRAQTVRGAHAAALQNYGVIVAEYSGEPSARFRSSNAPPAYAMLDEVLYAMASEQAREGDMTAALKTYRDLVKRMPTSKFAPYAYLAFGEHFFAQAAADPSMWPIAKEAYSKVLAHSPPANKVYGYAAYKLAHASWNAGDLPRAVDAFKKAIEHGTAYAQAPNAPRLVSAARKDLVAVYAMAGAPSEAYALFRSVSGDDASSSEKTLAMLNDLGAQYVATGHLAEAAALYRDLLARSTEDAPRRCEYLNRSKEASFALGKRDECPDCP